MKTKKVAGKVTLKIPRSLYDNLGEIIDGTGFTSVTEFVVFAMRTIASGGDVAQGDVDKKAAKTIRERLKRLGYLE